METEIIFTDYYADRRAKRLRSAIILLTCLIVIGVICLCSSCGVTPARAYTIYADKDGVIDLNTIKQIESAGNPLAVSSRGAYGAFQITQPVLDDYNRAVFGTAIVGYDLKDMFNLEYAENVATWYLNVEIPRLLKHYGKAVNEKNILICYNAGIRAVVKGYLPKETKNYLVKYERLQKGRG